MRVGRVKEWEEYEINRNEKKTEDFKEMGYKLDLL